MTDGGAIEGGRISVQRGLMKRWRPRRSLSAPQSSLIERVLAARGFESREAMDEFFDIRLSRLHDPSLMPELDRAAERILSEASRGGRIIIYGDYDVDGVTATAILIRTLRALAPAARVSWYIPHRVDEGYGLNSDAISALCGEIGASGSGVIVSVDCGVTARAEAMLARERGVDLIITDHHNPPETIEDLPPAYAVVHPRRPDSRYPFGELSGAGVAYKLAWRLATMSSGSARVSDDLRGLLIELLALAALGTIADVVPLVGENRIIARYGLGRIKNSSFTGLRALVEASGLAGEDVDAQGVGFKLAPRLNACGRLGHANQAAELLTTEDAGRAAEIARGLTATNDQRRKVEGEIFDEAVALALEKGMTTDDRRAIVLAREGWHTGVVGIVCSRMVERFGRPCILMGMEDGMCHGSGRSVEGFSLHGALEKCREHLVTFGGHDMAAGLRVNAASLEVFVDAFTRVANDAIAACDLCGLLEFDADSSLQELSVEVVRELARLEPFGRHNPPVRVRLEALRIMDAPRLLGSSGKHLALQVRDAAGNWSRLVAWNWGSRIGELRGGQEIDAVVTPKVSTFGGLKVEPVIEDLMIVRR